MRRAAAAVRQVATPVLLGATFSLFCAQGAFAAGDSGALPSRPAPSDAGTRTLSKPLAADAGTRSEVAPRGGDAGARLDAGPVRSDAGPLASAGASVDGGPGPPGVACGDSVCFTFPTARAAFAKLLERQPVVLGLGEYHEVQGMPKVKSALKRFTEGMLPQLKGRASALVVETWITTGRCGEVEKKAVEEVQKVTKRPVTTEDEVTTMLTRSYELGIENHILTLTCDEYASMVGADGELDGEKSLLMVRRKVQEKADELRERGLAGVAGKPLVLYGGAFHNDLYPAEGTEDFSFGPALQKSVGAGYLELDLLVPEYVEKDEDLAKASWFRPAMKLSAAGKTVLVEPRPGSLVLIFPRTR